MKYISLVGLVTLALIGCAANSRLDSPEVQAERAKRVEVASDAARKAGTKLEVKSALKELDAALLDYHLRKDSKPRTGDLNAVGKQIVDAGIKAMDERDQAVKRLQQEMVQKSLDRSWAYSDALWQKAVKREIRWEDRALHLISAWQIDPWLDPLSAETQGVILSLAKQVDSGDITVSEMVARYGAHIEKLERAKRVEKLARDKQLLLSMVENGNLSVDQAMKSTEEWFGKLSPNERETQLEKFKALEKAGYDRRMRDREVRALETQAEAMQRQAEALERSRSNFILFPNFGAPQLPLPPIGPDPTGQQMMRCSQAGRIANFVTGGCM